MTEISRLSLFLLFLFGFNQKYSGVIPTSSLEIYSWQGLQGPVGYQRLNPGQLLPYLPAGFLSWYQGWVMLSHLPVPLEAMAVTYTCLKMSPS